MTDEVMATKMDPITHRALRIYCATKGIDKKEAVTMALKATIPSNFFEIAGTEYRREEAGNNGKG